EVEVVQSAAVVGGCHSSPGVRIARVARPVTLCERTETRQWPSYGLNQYDSFTRNVLLGFVANRLLRSRLASKVPGLRASARPCCHTTNSTEPGRYSQRNTRFELNCLELNPAGSAPP